MPIRFGFVTSLTLSLTIAPLAVPSNPVTQVILAPAVAQTVEAQMAEADQLLQLCREQLKAKQFEAALQSCEQSAKQFEALGDRSKQGRSITNTGIAYARLGQQQEAIEQYQIALPIVREAGDREAEGIALIQLITSYDALSQSEQAIEPIQELLTLAQETQNRAQEGVALALLSVAYVEIRAYQQSIAPGQQALPLLQEAGNQSAEIKILNYLSWAYQNISQYQESLDAAQRALSISREVEDRSGEANALNNLANAYQSLSQYQQAIEYYQQALPIAQQIQERDSEAYILSNLGVAHAALSKYSQAIEYYQQALPIFREIQNRNGEAMVLSNLGSTHDSLSQYQKAIEYYQQALPVFQEIQNRNGEANVLNNLGRAYNSLSQFRQAIEYHQQALTIFQQVDNLNGESNALLRLGLSYNSLSEYEKAIHFYQQSLLIYQQVGDRNNEAWTLNNLGLVHKDLGQYQQSIKLLEQALPIFRQIGERNGESATLYNLGVAYWYLNQPQRAIELWQQALPVFQEIGNRSSAAMVLNGLGYAQWSLNQYQKSTELLQQALALWLKVDQPGGEALTMHNLGLVYNSLGQYETALSYYYRSLSILQSVGARDLEAQALSTIGKSLELQNQPELAIVFFKQSVNVRESIRDGIRGLSQELQQSYTDSVASDYRKLADLLLQQNRVLEAQRVLDLLRVQELDEYLQGVRSTAQTESGVDLLNPEVEISNRTVAVGYELASLRAIPYAQLSEPQKQRLSELDTQQHAFIQDFQGFINSPEIQALVKQLSPDAQNQDVLAELDEFINLQNNLRALNQNAVLIYPLILEDRLELVLVTPFSEPTRYPVAVERAELNAAIVEFRQAITDPTRDPKPVAQKLYQWLIAPMADDLAAIDAETILYAPDDALRYIPLAALHDGNQWLIEHFRINHITAASLQNFTLQPAAQPRILAAAFSDGRFEFSVGQRSFSFDGLPFAGVEVENLVAAFPNTTSFVNDTFSRSAIEPVIDNHNIVHLATHAAFVQGSPADSFILFGNGDRLSLQEIKETWQGRFNQVDLIVLSACETGLGGDTLGNGEEILGFGYLMQEAGASAAIASLWQVSDGGTQVLMNAFYSALENGMTKAEALRQAQIALITGDFTAVGSIRGDATITAINTETGLPASLSEQIDHPFYWAPFILIGNGL